MKILVNGGSGFVGREILRLLDATPHAVRVLVHRSTKLHGVDIHRGSVLDAASLAGAVTGIDAVIHLVGIISECGTNTFENVHTLGTKNVVGAAKAAGVRRFVHMSALGTRADALARYHKTKWAAEEIVRQGGMDWTIFRPSIIYGRNDLFVNLFAGMSRFSPILPVIGTGESKLQPVPVEDVAACFVRSLSEPRSIGQTFDLCGAERLSFVEMLDTILSVTRRKRWKPHIPLGLARLQATLLEFAFPRFLRKPPPLNRDQLIMLQENNVGNPEPANELFGLKPVGFREGISRYLVKR
jgi:uncharacterized protein YbjT (DUF2867 family)